MWNILIVSYYVGGDKVIILPLTVFAVWVSGFNVNVI